MKRIVLFLLLMPLVALGEYLELGWVTTLPQENVSNAFTSISAGPDASIYLAYTTNSGQLLRFARLGPYGGILWRTHRQPYPNQGGTNYRIRKISAGHVGALAVFTGTIGIEQDIAATIAIDTLGSSSHLRELRESHLYPYTVYAGGQFTLMADYYDLMDPSQGSTWIHQFNASGAFTNSVPFDQDNRSRHFCYYHGSTIPGAQYLIHTTNNEIAYIDEDGQELGRTVHDAGTTGRIFSRFDGSINLLHDATLTLLNADGSMIWSRELDNQHGYNFAAVYDPGNGFVALTKEDESIYCACYNLNGDLVSEEYLQLEEDDNFTYLDPPVITWGGQIVFVGRNENNLKVGKILVDEFPQEFNGVREATEVVNEQPSLDVLLAPNPTNSMMTITLSLPSNTFGYLTVYDISGRIVQSLAAPQIFPTGQHHFVWNSSEHGSGIYFVRLQADGTSVTRKLVVLK